MLSLVLPTYNEAKNIESVLADITAAMGDLQHEIIVADDDSPDGTWKIAEGLRPKFPAVRVIRRTVNRGLSPAVVDGFRIAEGDVLMVMDADGQHDPRLIRELYDAIQNGATIAVASRYIAGGSVGDWVTGRRLLSKTATMLAGWLSSVRIADPLSGFFAVDTKAYRTIEKDVRPVGFKILLEVLAHLPRGSKGTEVPLHFRVRTGGESKLSPRVQLQFIAQVARLAAIRLLRSWMIVFVLACAVIAALLLSRIPRILPLALDPTLRTKVDSALRAVADRDGLLLSGFSLHRIAADHVDVQYRDYHRGTDTVTCMRLTYDPFSSAPCDAS